ncbi:hypothetical protein BDR06DRAFT_974775 [Suillus hirtellus]|nr:hypothetical protein BDR06DRAFT_974775 [Suillus hirtellus]
MGTLTGIMLISLGLVLETKLLHQFCNLHNVSTSNLRWFRWLTLSLDKVQVRTLQPIVRTQAGSIKKLRQKTNAKLKAEEEQATAQLENLGHWSDKDTNLLLETLLGGNSEFYEYLTGKSNGRGDPDIEELDEKVEMA